MSKYERYGSVSDGYEGKDKGEGPGVVAREDGEGLYVCWGLDWC